MLSKCTKDKILFLKLSILCNPEIASCIMSAVCLKRSRGTYAVSIEKVPQAPNSSRLTETFIQRDTNYREQLLKEDMTVPGDTRSSWKPDVSLHTETRTNTHTVLVESLYWSVWRNEHGWLNFVRWQSGLISALAGERMAIDYTPTFFTTDFYSFILDWQQPWCVIYYCYTAGWTGSKYWQRLGTSAKHTSYLLLLQECLQYCA